MWSSARAAARPAATTASRSRSVAPRSAAASSDRASVNGDRSSTRGMTLRRATSTPAEGTAVERVDPADVDRRVAPSQRPGEVDQAAGGQEVLDRTGRLLVDLAPGVVGDRRQLSHQMVHGSILLSLRRLPMPEASPCPARCGLGQRVGRGRPDPGQGIAIDVVEGLVAIGDVQHAVLLVRPGAVVVHRDAHPVAEGPELLIEEGIGQDAVDLGPDRGLDLELGGVRLRRAAGQQHLAAGDGQCEGDGRGWPAPTASSPPGRGRSPPRRA